MKKINTFLCLIYALLLINQATFAQNVWQNIDNVPTSLGGVRQIIPQKFRIVQLNNISLSNKLSQTSLEFTTSALNTNSILELPMPDGKMLSFDIVESPIMEEALAKKFPEIKTYSGYCVDNKAITVRFDITPAGFHAMILSPEGTVFIDPYSTGTKEFYISYHKSDFNSSKIFSCDIDKIQQPNANSIKLNDDKNSPKNSPFRVSASFGDSKLRTYRLALAATGEYTTFHGGTVAGALAAQVTTMNRVNGIYLRDLAVKMIIIANNDLLIYTNGSTDPYTNNDGVAMLSQNQNNINAVIGNSNYDIGHVFSTGGGGIATLRSPCSSTLKARGVTGQPNPVGDPFDVDYVAHEMGHQFGGNHTQNNNCNRNSSTAFEPGSASTIMGYAGICAPNVQSNSDDYFHGGNLAEMHTFIVGAGNACAVQPSYTNATPAISSNTASQTIPRGTPFVLTATATDADGNASLTYCWEQMDNEVITHPPTGTATGGPIFRSLNPSTNNARYFPKLNDLVNNTTSTWEVLPTVARSLKFRLVVRDNAVGGGYNDSADITLTVSGTSGPFVVNIPNNTGISWSGTSTQTVTWSVANTDIAPVSCSNVDILLSTDGGLTYPITVASNIPNTGTASITVPNVSTTTARIMVRGTGRAFFDISDNNFAITTTSCSPPTGATAGSNSPVLVGGTINLTSSSTGGTSQVWAGPNSFTSTDQNPVITSATAGMAGVYTVTITSSGTCTATATTSVVVNPAPTSCSPPTAATAGSNSPVTVGSPINLTSSSTGGTSQVWAGPNSFTSIDQNPVIASATAGMAGVYTVTITSSGTCTATATVNVMVNPAPTSCSPPTGATAGSNSPVLVGGTINLTSSSTGGTSQVWAGPNSFTSIDQNPIITSATAGMAGVYTVTITSSGTCTATATVNVMVNPAPTSCSPPTAATAGSNSPVTVGSPINLTSSSTGGTSQVWAGPNSFTSIDQNPVIASATLGMAGVYTVTITSSGTCTATATTSVVVNPLPTGAVVFVNVANVSPTQDGNSWATAYSNLQTALSTSPANAEIWVAQGTYKPTASKTQTISFNIPSGAMLFGGFVGTEVAQNQRNFNNNPTILSGEIGSSSSVNDNSYHVVTFVGANNMTRLDGFTITGGNANLTDLAGTITNIVGSVPVSINDGGGIALDGSSSPTIINCKIINNNAIFGGGLFATNGSNSSVINCVFMGNKATFGGGVYHVGSNPTYNNVLFAGNKATGGGAYNNGSNPTFTNVTIAGNDGLNGAIFNSGSTPTVKNSIIWGNTMPFNDTQSVITNSIVEGGFTGIGNLNLNPQFVSQTPYGLSPNTSGDYQLTNTSPAIDAGDNGAISLTDKDLIGNLRRYNGGIVDMGAYEFQGSRVGGTVTSIASGNWETGSTWNIGRKPLAGDMVIIDSNHVVTINQDGVLKNIELKPNAQLMYNTAGIKLQTGF